METQEPRAHSTDAPSGRAFDRRGVDRRRNHLKAFFVQFRSPRRRHASRREHDGVGFHSDFHEPAILLVVLVTMSLCVVDVYATLTLLQHGGRELNPIMRHLLEVDVWLFYVLKYGVTAAGLFVLVSYRWFTLYKSFSGLHTLYGIMAVYVLLAIYQIRLLASAAG